MAKEASSQVIADIVINKYKLDDTVFYSLTDMARYKDSDNPNNIIRSWLANQNNLEFLKEWEQINNPNFKPSQLRGFKGYERYVLDQFMKRTGSVSRFIEYTDAAGLKVTRLRSFDGQKTH